MEWSDLFSCRLDLLKVLRELFHPLASQVSGVNGEWESAIKILQGNTFLTFHIPHLVWNLYEKVRKSTNLTAKTHFLSDGKCNFTLGWHVNICLFLSPGVLLGQQLGVRDPRRGIYFSFLELFSLVMNTKSACMQLEPGALLKACLRWCTTLKAIKLIHGLWKTIIEEMFLSLRLINVKEKELKKS